MRRLLLVLWMTTAVVAAQGLPQAQPEQVGLSAERLQRIGALIEEAVERQEIAGGVALVARRGKVAFLQTAGMRNLEAGQPMATDTVFRIASMTKAVTSVAVMMLHEEGRFLLSDPVSKYLPEFKQMRVLAADVASDADPATVKTEPARGPITIRQLLSHTSGLTYRFIGRKPLAAVYRQAGIQDGLHQIEGTLADMVRRLAGRPLLFQPGERWEYSLATDVLGRLVEVVSGQTLDEFFRRRIFEPLRMTETSFFLPDHLVPRLAAVYTPKEGGGLRPWPEEPVDLGDLVFSAGYPYQGPRTYFSGGGGLSSTTSDYARFLQMLLNGGHLEGARLLSRKSVELMTRNHIGQMTGFARDGERFGLGFAVHEDAGRTGRLASAGEYGWGGFFYTRFWVDPAEQMFGLFMTQVYPNDQMDLANRIRVVAYAAIID